jgi:transglutaminase-like putative cysteine protease
VTYSVRHVTLFRYQPGIRESVMEVRMQPRSDAHQRCLSFNLDVSPNANVISYRDFLGNTVHHFDIAGRHSEVRLTAAAMVELQPAPEPRPEEAGEWADLDQLIAGENHWEMLLPSQFAQSSERLEELAGELGFERRGNPLELLGRLNTAIYEAFSYVPNSTKVDSPIDEALRSRQGVCQDFAHIMIALVRRLRIPCRYVSGYLCHGSSSKDRSPESASHAWVEALVPKIGWVALDPTNDLVGSERHIKVAIGRDYADVPPTRGVYKGEAESELSVVVTVAAADAPAAEELAPSRVLRPRPPRPSESAKAQYEQQQQ